MTTAKSSNQHCLACLARLRLAVPDKRTARADMEAQLMVYAEKLTRFSPEAVKAACDGWGDEHTEWPTPAELMALAGRHERGGSSGPPIEGQNDALNAALEEALAFTSATLNVEIYKLAQTDPVAKRWLISDLAKWWAGARPASGPQTEVERRQCVNAVEAWLEDRLGRKPMPKLAEADPKAMPQRDIRPLVRSTVERAVA